MSVKVSRQDFTDHKAAHAVFTNKVYLHKYILKPVCNSHQRNTE